MLFACDVISESATTSTEGEKSLYELWFGTAPTPDHMRSLGVVEYARRSVRKHKMPPKEEKYVFMRILRNFPSGTASVLLVQTSKIVEKQAVQWIDGLDKTDSGRVGNEDLGAKPGGDKSVVKIGAP